MNLLTFRQLTISRFYLVFLAGLAALGPLSIDVYMPVLPDLATEFNATSGAVMLTMSTYMIGMALGQFAGGPISDQIGRKATGIIGLLLFAASSVLIILVSSIQEIQMLRIFQAIGAGFATVICMAQVRDIFPAEQVSKKLANVILVMLLAPLIGPSLGTLISTFGWRAIFIFLVTYGVFMSTMYAAYFPETHITRSNTLSLRKMGAGYWSALSLRTNEQLVALRYAIFGALSAGIFFSYITNVSFIFIEQFGLSKIQFSLVFAANGLTMIGGNRLAVRLMYKFDSPTILRYTNICQIVFLASIGIATLLFELSLIIVIPAFMFLTMLSGILSPTASGYFISLHERNLGSASSIYSTLFYASGGLIGGGAALLSDGKLAPIFAVMLGSGILANLTLSTIKRV